jgi:hypothetical protein
MLREGAPSQPVIETVTSARPPRRSQVTLIVDLIRSRDDRLGASSIGEFLFMSMLA